MNLSRLCQHDTLFAVNVFLLDDRHGYEVAVAVAKLSWMVSADGEPRIAVPQRPVRTQHEYGGPDRLGSLDYPSDMVEEKPGTDILLVGQGYPATQDATQQDVGLHINTAEHRIHKTVRVFGSRVFEQRLGRLAPGQAKPLGVTPLVYQLAFGGIDDCDGNTKIEWRNPVGLGVAVHKKELVGKAAYVLETVDGTEPAGFGAIAEHWSPRRELAGSYDTAWSKKRAPLRPTDFDPKHHAAAHPDLWSSTPLQGDEPVELFGATPEGSWRFRLPHHAPRFTATIAGQTTSLETHLDTYLIDVTDPERRIIELCWRAAVRLPRKSEQLESIAVYPTSELSQTLYERLDADLAQLRATTGHEP